MADMVDEATTATRALLTALDIPATAGTADTARRMACALVEMTDGLRADPAEHLARTFPAETDDPGMITVPDIAFTALCEHHMLPFTGHMVVSYIPKPGAPIVGVSKLARMALGYAARPQVQERLGADIIAAIMTRLDADGAGCLIYATHACMTGRGARANGAGMLTSHLAGAYRADPQVRGEFLSLNARFQR